MRQSSTVSPLLSVIISTASFHFQYCGSCKDWLYKSRKKIAETNCKLTAV
ncbi:hypothetical protein CGMCC3_g17648 [Colletotrichum fructicola]|nr:uncharacterized protein CGMCC3_g17648 [Colletotrichum fructicola]KAE9566189.1 hypothetical protein CGMCC3_g17648 [Colletotrichum fructicola]